MGSGPREKVERIADDGLASPRSNYKSRVPAGGEAKRIEIRRSQRKSVNRVHLVECPE